MLARPSPLGRLMRAAGSAVHGPRAVGRWPHPRGRPRCLPCCMQLQVSLVAAGGAAAACGRRHGGGRLAQRVEQPVERQGCGPAEPRGGADAGAGHGEDDVRRCWRVQTRLHCPCSAWSKGLSMHAIRCLNLMHAEWGAFQVIRALLGPPLHGLSCLQMSTTY